MWLLTPTPGTVEDEVAGPTPSRHGRARAWHADIDMAGWDDARFFRLLDSATIRRDTLPRGSWRVRIEHEPLRGVTPGMLVWWYGHFPYLEIGLPGGQTVSGYRIWHPLDNRDARVTHHSLSGQLGYARGAQLDLEGFWGAFPRRSCMRVRRMDDGGHLAHFIAGGVVVAAIRESFLPSANGTRFVSALTVATRPSDVRRLPRDRAFDTSVARAWAEHAIEATGNLQRVIPALYAAMAKRNETLGSAGPPARTHHDGGTT